MVGGARAQSASPRPPLRIVSYVFRVALPDSGGAFAAQAVVGLRRAKAGPDSLVLDLVGLTVDSVTAPGATRAARHGRRPFAYDGREIRVALGPRRGAGVETVTVFYHGAPTDGLFLRPDARGRPSAFADDWPDRARDWIPSVDDPADKAPVRWEVSVPAGWEVVANGRFMRREPAASGRATWIYDERRPIPTYTMVLGAGRMTISRHRPAVLGNDSVPIEVWAEPEDSAFADSVPFRRATEIVETMERLVGPFPFEKLAQVESSTRYGGMENSTAIFYPEQPYVARRLTEGVVRHETAHQWFGDAVTERDFHDLWLSEGFADYFAVVVGAALDGDSVMQRGMAGLMRGYLRSPVVGRPLVDSAETVLTRLLNANSYNKGACVLHMLRRTVGDSAFWRGIRAYYREYRDSSVTSADFERVMERAAGRQLGWFFAEWLHQPGYPQLDVAWRWDSAGHRLSIDLAQVQPAAWGRFTLPALTLEFSSGSGQPIRRTVALSSARQSVQWDVPQRPTDVRVDPDGDWLLTAQVHPQP